MNKIKVWAVRLQNDGRLTIPMGLRKEMEIVPGSLLFVQVEGEDLLITIV
jgi:bifunctional DNA-binding transcriptional regulator/antitoxin component of YhaV-PrlF toxin-antitoxin module